MVGRRKKPKKDDSKPAAAPRQAGYRDWDNIVPGEPLAQQPYAEQSWQSPPAQTYPTQAQPQAAPAAAAPPPQQPYQQPAPQPQPYQQPAPPQPQYQQPPQQYQQPTPQYQQTVAPPPPQPMPAAAPAPVGGLNPTDGNCIKCGAAFGQKAVCDGCGGGRTACLVCGTKIWAGALTCSAHSNAMRR